MKLAGAAVALVVGASCGSTAPNSREPVVAQPRARESRQPQSGVESEPQHADAPHRATPAPYVDERGVTVLFNDHRWFCFQVEGMTMSLCATSGRECYEFAVALKSSPTCGIAEAATCLMMEDINTRRNVSKCFSSSKECLDFGSAFVDEETRVTNPCVTLRYQGF